MAALPGIVAPEQQERPKHPLQTKHPLPARPLFAKIGSTSRIER
jgi:hypothetical protein